MTTSTLTLEFPAVAGRTVNAVCDGGDVTSDAGVLLLTRADTRLGLTARLAAGLRDARQASKVAHQGLEMLRARVFGIAQGYEDCNDFDRLGSDPGFKVACERLPATGDELASQPTLSRFENARTPSELVRLGTALLEAAVTQLPPDTKRVVIDVDPTDDPCHGQQQLSFFNGFYDAHCFLPLQVTVQADGGRQWPAAALLRSGKAGPTVGLASVLRPLVRTIRQRCPQARIELRADSGFGCDAVLRLCHALDLDYTLGLKGNAVLERLTACVKAKLEAQVAQARAATPDDPHAGDGQRVYQLFPYQAGPWVGWERVVLRAEWTQGTYNPRFIVTNRVDLTGRESYEHYCGRGECENRIKEFKLDLSGGRTSCHRFLANQFRLLLHLAAALLLAVLQEALAGTAYARAQISTLRTRLLKVGAKVVQTVRRIWFHLPTSFPGQDIWARLCQRLT
ncbi:MAG: IS1380 family transposase [Armatimonadota bacterium]